MEDLKKVCLGTIFALLVQAGCIVWWASSVSASVAELQVFEAESKQFYEKWRMVETKVEINRVILERLEKKFDQRTGYPN